MSAGRRLNPRGGESGESCRGGRKSEGGDARVQRLCMAATTRIRTPPVNATRQATAPRDRRVARLIKETRSPLSSSAAEIVRS